MQNILIWLRLVLTLFIVDIISSNDDILSKFHQNGFKVKDVRIELINYSQEYFNFFEIKTFKFNRTTPATNTTFQFKIDVKDKVETLVQVQKFLSNEYRRFPARFQLNLQRAFKADALGLASIKNCGNITSFSFEKDIVYHSCNFVIDESRFPPLVPNGRFRADQQLLYLNEKIALFYVFHEIYTPMPYPKT